MTFNNLVDVLRSHAEARPEARALTFLQDGESMGDQLSFAELDLRARALAATLAQLTRPGDRALLIYQPGLEFAVAFLACQYAGVIAVPAPPPNERRPSMTIARVFGIVSDARPSIVLTTANLLGPLRSASHDRPAFAELLWQASDRIDRGRAALWSPPSLTGEELSFLQYTSGSTSAPKGVMVSHRNLMANLAMLRETAGEPGTIVSWLPVFHDMGLIGNLLLGFYVGAETRLMSPLSFIKRPLRWLRAIAAGDEVLSGAPNFAFDMVLGRLDAADKQGLDLSSWKVAFCGAETVRAATLARFCEEFAECGFDPRALLPCYGLAEATLIVSGRTPGRPYRVRTCDKARLEQGAAANPGTKTDAVEVVSCGSTKGDQLIAIVDPDTREPRPDGAVGEIWVRGDNVARGYWDNREKTAETFAATTTTGEGPFLRTGDLGFSIDGELHVTGRIKELIIIRGRCLYPQDLELMVESMADEFPEIAPNQSAAFALVGDQHERIGLIVKVARRKNPSYDSARLIEAIQARILAELEVGFEDIALISSSVPKTSSGKKMRTFCAAQMHAGLEEFEVIHRWRRVPQRVAPASETEAETEARSPGSLSQAQLATLMVEWIAREERVDPSMISTRQSFAELGLDSVAAVSLVDYLERELGTTISSAVFEQVRTIDELAHHLS